VDLELELDGDLIDYGAMPTVLTANGSGVYSASSCQAVECQSMDGGVIIYSRARIERTSSTTIHGTQAGTGTRTTCTEGVCPDGFGSNAPACDFDATMAEPAPVITSVSPSSTSSSSCSEPLTIHGGYFQPGATVSYVSAAPSCASITMLRDRTLACGMVVDKVTGTAITVHFAACPTQDEAFQMTLTLAITNPAESGNPGLESLTSVELDP